MGKVIRRIELRLWLFFWLVTIGVWSLVNTRLGMKIVRDYHFAEKVRRND